MKIEQILPPRLGRRVAALQAMIVTRPSAELVVDARALSTIAGACRDQETLRFRYRDHTGRATTRAVEPHRLVAAGNRWYLVAWDSGRKAWRTFRVDRIQSRLTTGPRFSPRDPPSRDLAAYVSCGAWSTWQFRARIKLLAAAEVMAERIPSWVGLIEPIDQHSCLVETGAPSFESLAMHLSLLGVDFEVAGPAELVDEVRRLGNRYLQAVASALL
jgi:predicted DNA-binding transcriptional regulator YafY